MRLITFEHAGRTGPGLMVEGERIIDLGRALADRGERPAQTLVDIIEGGAAAMNIVRDIEKRVANDSSNQTAIPFSAVRLLAPIPKPRKNIFCVGRNYKDHVAEGARARGAELKLPEFPQFFTKPPLAVIGPDHDIPWDPEVTQKLDYEVELGVVIGTTGRNISRDKALDHVFGYTVINDVTARDLQRRHEQWFKGKGIDGSCPMGPWIVDAASIPNPQDIEVKLRVNGEERQRETTAMMIFDIKEIISQLSLGLTLEPGDVIATGTPSGVGFAMDPPRFLGDGDVIEAEVQGVGILRNRVRRMAHATGN